MARIDEGLVKQLALYLTVIFEVALPPIAGFVIGRYIDDYFGTTPFLSLILLLAGIGAGLRQLLILKEKFEKKE